MQMQSGAVVRSVRPHVGRVNGDKQVPASTRGQEVLEQYAHWPVFGRHDNGAEIGLAGACHRCGVGELAIPAQLRRRQARVHLGLIFNQSNDVEVRAGERGCIGDCDGRFQVWQSVLELQHATGERRSDDRCCHRARTTNRLANSAACRGADRAAKSDVNNAHHGHRVVGAAAAGGVHGRNGRCACPGDVRDHDLWVDISRAGADQSEARDLPCGKGTIGPVRDAEVISAKRRVCSCVNWSAVCVEPVAHGNFRLLRRCERAEDQQERDESE